MNRFFCIFFVFFLFWCNMCNIFAQGYYADIIIDVDDKGRTSITGSTNYLFFENVSLSDDFTSKIDGNWLFNISSDVVFSDFVYRLNLPEGVDVNYIKTTKNFRIDDSGDGIALVGSGSNRNLEVVVQYSIDNDVYDSLDGNVYLIAFFSGVGFFFVLFLSFAIYRRYFDKTKQEIVIENAGDVIERFHYDNLTVRQKKIVDLLSENEKLTQTQISRMLDIPKSSVSRNVSTLEVKGFVQREESGISNFVFLRK